MAGRLLLLFIVLPLAETYLLIKVGGIIGAVPTILAVIATAVIGSYFIRIQGLNTIRRVQLASAQGEVPAVEMLEGIALLLAGVLLITPGFITDTLGFLVLVPGLRRRTARRILQQFVIVQTGGRAQRYPDAANAPENDSGPKTIEGEYRREDD